MSWIVVHNEGARKGRRVLEMVQEALSSCSERFNFCPVGALPNCDVSPERVVVVGGDGTVNLTTNWLHANGLYTTLALVPAGTGNNLAGGLGLPSSVPEAIDVALTGRDSTSRRDSYRCR